MKWWRPEYGTPDDKWALPGISTNECPVSLITEESINYVEMFEKSRLLRGHGAMMYGLDLSKWPTWAIDVFNTLEVESARADKLVVQVASKPKQDAKSTHRS
jgi:hypothetical protein